MIKTREINQLVGPIFGPCMRRLHQQLREVEPSAVGMTPSSFAQLVHDTFTQTADVSTDQCPEMFAAQCLQAMGYEVDMEQAKRDSAKFQSNMKALLSR